MRTHELKCVPAVFNAIEQGRKTADIRFNDRGFEEGDRVVQMEYLPVRNTFTGRKHEFLISNITHLADWIEGVDEKWVMLSMSGLLTRREG